jgi:excisionase family DNA binding protein
VPVSIDRRFLDAKEAGRYLSVSRTTVYCWMNEGIVNVGKLPSLKVNSKRLFDVNQLDEFVEKLKAEQQKMVDHRL